MAIKKDRCIPIDERYDSLVNHVQNMDPATSPTAGCGITIVDSVISAAPDGVSIICEDGVLKAIAASDLTAGDGITIALGVISAKIDTTTIVFDGSGNLVSPPQDALFSITGDTGDTLVADDPETSWSITGAGGISCAVDDAAKSVVIDGSGVTGGGGGGTANVLHGKLATDLTEDMSEVSVTVTHYNGTSPGSTVTCKNPDNLLHPSSGKYFFIGNFDSQVMAAYYDSSSEWRLEFVQPPTTVPVAP